MACYLIRDKEGNPKVGFIHIYKNGGMSVRKEIDRICKDRGYTQEVVAQDEGSLFLNKQAFEHWGDDWGHAYKFAIVRLPYSRMVSLYHFIIQRKQKPLFDMIKGKSFKQFMQMTFEHKTGANVKQKDYVLVDNVMRVQHICHLETLEQDLKVVNAQTGLDFKIKHDNKSQHKHWSQYFPKSVLNATFKFFKEDFELFGYTKQGNLS